MTEPSAWTRITQEDPGHSAAYVQRFRDLAAQGTDLVGEARLVDAMLPRGSRVLDAGCGPGRVGGFLHSVGHDVVGVDVDPVLIAAAEEDHPGPRWLVGDLAELDLPAAGIAEPFDAVVSAGNVMAFLAPSTRGAVLQRLRAHVAADGRAAIGFGAGRGYAFDAFFADVAAAGMRVDVALSTWDVRPFADGSDFLVAVLSPA
jgi:SAM-dependent methyltransferase